MRKQLLLSVMMFIFTLCTNAQSFVAGGQFRDRILPMIGKTTPKTLRAENPAKKVWGAADVQNRYIDNGIEVDGMNIWGGNVYHGDDGLYHQFVAGWDGINRAFSYWSNSHIYHFTSKTPHGPFTNPVDIGAGHNPEVYRAKDGTYVVYSLIGNRACWRHVSKSLNGPWKFEQMPYNLRDRALLTGSTTTYSNWTFAQRPDSSMLCMCRGGGIWISRDGMKEYAQVKGVSCYPNGGGRTFEDPVVWKDEFQYHMIVNDWQARIAYYSRSADGFHWVAEDGVAYDINIAWHPDGEQEKWYKYERARVFQDKYGRAIQLNMAVIDTIKGTDLANDNHSSKNIAMPLNPGLRMAVLNSEKITTATQKIKVIIYKEEGFNPKKDLNIPSLRFGSYAIVNKGGGATVESYKTDKESNLVLVFNGKDTGIKDDEFAPKLLGNYASTYINPNTPTAKAGSLCYGYARLPYYNYSPAYLSPVLPKIDADGMLTSVRVDNYGLSDSEDGISLKVLASNGTVLATGTVGKIKPYSSYNVPLTAMNAIPKGSAKITVALYKGGVQTDVHPLTLAAITALQAKFVSIYNDAAILYNNQYYANGRQAMEKAMTVARQAKDGFYEPELVSASNRLKAAIQEFQNANPGVPNVSCRNYYIKSGNMSSGNIYMSVSGNGTLERKSICDRTCVFSLIIDGDKGRAYLYNPSSKSFVVAKAGKNDSYWTASATNAYQLAGVSTIGTVVGTYLIKGDPSSTNTSNFLSAYGGANRTELTSFVQESQNCQWIFTECADQTYTFDVTSVTTGLDDFKATAGKIYGGNVIPATAAKLTSAKKKAVSRKRF